MLKSQTERIVVNQNILRPLPPKHFLLTIIKKEIKYLTIIRHELTPPQKRTVVSRESIRNSCQNLHIIVKVDVAGCIG